MFWPDGKIFGTICVLDAKANNYSDHYRELLWHFRDVVQVDLKTLCRWAVSSQRKGHTLTNCSHGVRRLLSCWDFDAKIQPVNAAFTKIFGYTEEDALGQSTTLIDPEDLREEIKGYRDKVIDKCEVIALKTVRRRKDGTCIPVSLIGVSMSSGGTRSSACAIYRDISARQPLEDELRHERGQLRIHGKHLSVRVVAWCIRPDLSQTRFVADVIR